MEDVDSVRVFGMVNSQEEKGKIETLVKGVKGIKQVANDLIVIALTRAGL